MKRFLNVRHGKWLALPLAAALCLGVSGCGAAEISAADDVCMETAGIAADTVLLTVDGREITAEEYLYWSSLVLDTFYYNYVSGSDADDAECTWVGEYWEDGLSPTVLGYLLNYNEPIAHASELGFVMDAETLASEVDARVADYKANYEDEGTFALYLSQICMSEEGFRHIMEENVYYQAMQSYLFSDGGIYDPTDAEILEFADEQGYYNCRYVFFSTVGAYTDAAVESHREMAELLLQNLANSDDPDAYFAGVTADPNWNDDTEDGMGLLTAGGYINSTFDEAARALEIGEISGIVDNTDEYGYFVIQRLAIDPDDLREACRAYRFHQLVAEWVEAAEPVYTEAFDALDMQSFYVNLNSYRLSTDVEGETETAEA
ncbi:MAG: hypothetical protein LUD54_02715 [Oscillospiraceae bacterium]|nr:hypothetical protein [Oscillospiraceae bacterium]